MELQAIRYAAMVSAMDFEAVVKAYEKLLNDPKISEKHGTAPAEARQKLLDFLDAASAEEVAVSSTPRLVLMSPGFSKEITTTVLWLNNQGLDIRCLEVKPYKLDDQLYLDVEQMIPLPSAEGYIIQIGEKAAKAGIIAKAKRRENSIAALVNHDVLQEGTHLRLLKPPRPNMNITDEAAKRATFLGDGRAKWELDGEAYTLSGLCRRICEQFGGEVGSGAFAGPDYWAIEGETIALSERARNLGSTGNAKSHE